MKWNLERNSNIKNEQNISKQWDYFNSAYYTYNLHPQNSGMMGERYLKKW